MITILVAFLLIALSMAGLGLGLMFGRGPPQGGCGTPCAGCRNPCARKGAR
jgi:hypothetical protein